MDDFAVSLLVRRSSITNHDSRPPLIYRSPPFAPFPPSRNSVSLFPPDCTQRCLKVRSTPPSTDVVVLMDALASLSDEEGRERPFGGAHWEGRLLQLGEGGAALRRDRNALPLPAGEEPFGSGDLSRFFGFVRFEF